MRTVCLIILVLKFCSCLFSQSIIRNADFEYFSSCPDGISQIDKLDEWFMVSKSPDYFNCSFDRSPVDRSSTSVYSGNGSVGLLSHYDGMNSFSEAIGQRLSKPLLPKKLYRLSIMAKSAKEGSYSDQCRALELYGFKDKYLADTNFTHLSEKESSIYLGQSNIIENVGWRVQSISFIPKDTINVLAISLSRGQCKQYVMIDDLSVLLLELGENNSNSECSLFPNPIFINNDVELICKNEIKSFEVYDLRGVLIFQKTIKNFSTIFSLDTQGIYFVTFEIGESFYTKKLVVVK